MANQTTIDRDSLVADISTWDAITDHRTGSAGDKATDDWLRNSMQAAGLSPSVDAFEFERVAIHECTVLVDGLQISGVPMFDGGSTGPTPIEGQLGREILCAPSAPSTPTASLQKLRQAPACQALIAVSAPQGNVDGLALLNAESYHAPWGPPVVQVSSIYASQMQLYADAGARASVLAHTSRSQEITHNVTVSIDGTDSHAKPIVVMTPKSAWWTCTAERIGGICVWLALARHFAANPTPARIIFTANTGHELSHLGLDHFLEANAGLDAEFWFHLGANFASKDSAIHLQASSDFYMDKLTSHLGQHGVHSATQTPIAVRPAGEARNIYDIGGQYLSILGSNRWFHQPEDRWPDSIDPDRTCAIVNASISLMNDLMNA